MDICHRSQSNFGNSDPPPTRAPHTIYVLTLTDPIQSKHTTILMQYKPVPAHTHCASNWVRKFRLLHQTCFYPILELH